MNNRSNEKLKSIIKINQKITLMELEGIIEILPGNIIKIKE